MKKQKNTKYYLHPDTGTIRKLTANTKSVIFKIFHDHEARISLSYQQAKGISQLFDNVPYYELSPTEWGAIKIMHFNGTKVNQFFNWCIKDTYNILVRFFLPGCMPKEHISHLVLKPKPISKEEKPKELPTLAMLLKEKEGRDKTLETQSNNLASAIGLSIPYAKQILQGRIPGKKTLNLIHKQYNIKEADYVK